MLRRCEGAVVQLISIHLEAVIVNATEHRQILQLPVRPEEIRPVARGHEGFGLDAASHIDYWQVLSLFGLDVDQVLVDLLLQVQMIIECLYLFVQITSHIHPGLLILH